MKLHLFLKHPAFRKTVNHTLLGLSLALTSVTSHAQSFIQNYAISTTSTPHAFPFVSKNYSIIPADENTNDGYFMAGTVFDMDSDEGTALHLVKIKADGKVDVCNSVQQSYLYDDPFYTNERAVTLLSYDANTLVLVAQVTFSNFVTGVKLLFIDKCSGAVTRDEVFVVDAGGNPATFSIHPLDAVKNSVDGKIYIVGYSPEMAFSQTERSLLCFYDPAMPGALGIYGFAYNSKGNVQSEMNVHIKEMNTRSNGEMIITGACHMDDIPGSLSSSLAMIYDPAVGPSAIVALNTWGNEGDEYAYDAQENGDGTFYIFSNRFDNGPMIGGPIGNFPIISYTDVNLNVPTFENRRFHLIYTDFDDTEYTTWGTTLLHSQGKPSSRGFLNEEFILTGYNAQMPWQCTSSVYTPPALNNVNPFVGKFYIQRDLNELSHLSLFNTLSGDIGHWNIYYTDNGTGDFDTRGGFFSNIAFPTKNGIMHTGGNNDIVVTAPRVNPMFTPGTALSFKAFRTDNDLDINTGNQICDRSYRDCIPQVSLQDIISQDLINTFSWHGYQYTAMPGASAIVSGYMLNDEYDCQASSYYKPSVVQSVNQKAMGKFTIYPNPASNYIQISAENTGDNDLKVELVDVTGKLISNLYNGQSSALKDKRLQLPQVSPGLYIVRILSANGTQLNTQKINIQ